MEQIKGIFDSHAHYDDPCFSEDQDAVIMAQKAHGVDWILNAGCNLDTSRMGVALGEKYDFFFSSAGIHPGDIHSLPSDYIKQLEEILSQPKVVAIGEIGLDYHYEPFDRLEQIRIFTEQMELANKLKKPVIIHSREATEDTLSVLKQFPDVIGVVHCFSGSDQTAKQVLDLGYYIGFTGVVTFSNARKPIKAAEVVPLNRLLLETDAPYMAPVPFRGKRCTSELIAYTAQKLADIKQVPVQQLVDSARENTFRLFQIEEMSFQ